MYFQFASGIKIDCENTEGINEEHIHYCCKHPDGHNDIIEDCAKETNFLLQIYGSKKCTVKKLMFCF